MAVAPQETAHIKGLEGLVDRQAMPKKSKTQKRNSRRRRGGGRMGKFMPTAMKTEKLYVKSMTHWLCNMTVTRTTYIKHPSFTQEFATQGGMCGR